MCFIKPVLTTNLSGGAAYRRNSAAFSAYGASRRIDVFADKFEYRGADQRAATNYLTVLMLVVFRYLGCWDYDRLKPLFFARREIKSTFRKLELLWLPAIFSAVGALTVLIFAYLGIGNLNKQSLGIIFPLSAAGFIFGLICSLHHKYMKIGNWR